VSISTRRSSPSRAGLFVPKPSCDAGYQRRSMCSLRQTVRVCPLAFTAVRGDCHSVCHLVAREPVVSDCHPHTLSKSARLSPAWVSRVREPRPPVLCVWPNVFEPGRMKLRMRLRTRQPASLRDGWLVDFRPCVCHMEPVRWRFQASALVLRHLSRSERCRLDYSIDSAHY